MPIHPSQVRPGTKFIDDSLTTVQPEHRLHRIVEMTAGGFKAIHVASGDTRTFSINQINKLRQIPGGVEAIANLDWLTGEKVALSLRGHGVVVSGIVTSVEYHKVSYVDGGTTKELKQLLALELDKSSATRYEISGIERIQLL